MLDPHGRPLPARLEEILSLAAQGFTDKQIAQRLGIEPSTVESHWKRLRSLFDASTRIEILARAMRTRESLESLDKDKLIDKLLAEIDEKNRVEASLREAMAERDRMAMELIQITSIRPVALDSLESQAWRETIERAVENTGCMIYHAQLGPPWRKYRVTRNSVHMGFDPDTFSEALGADLPFYAPDMAAVFPVLAEGINQRALGVIWEYRVKVEGGLRWLRDYTCWRYADGQPLDYTGTCVDVTDLKVKAGESSPMTPVLVLKPSDWFFAPAMPVS